MLCYCLLISIFYLLCRTNNIFSSLSSAIVLSISSPMVSRAYVQLVRPLKPNCEELNCGSVNSLTCSISVVYFVTKTKCKEETNKKTKHYITTMVDWISTSSVACQSNNNGRGIKKQKMRKSWQSMSTEEKERLLEDDRRYDLRWQQWWSNGCFNELCCYPPSWARVATAETTNINARWR